MGEFHGDVSGSCTYESGITEAAGGRGSWGLWGGWGSERLRCFQNILLRFLRLAPAVGLSKDEFEFAVFLLALYPVVLRFLAHLPSLSSSLSRAPYLSLKALSNSQQLSPSRILLLKISSCEDFHKFPRFCVTTSGEGPKDNVVLNYFMIFVI